MQQGYLRLTILKILSKDPLSGYSLMQSIADLMGRKPSPGSIYPILQTLKKQRLITAHTHGRSITYSLTTKGKDHLHELLNKSHQLVSVMQQNLHCMESVLGEKQKGMQKFFDRLKRGEAPFSVFTPSMIRVRDTLLNAAEHPLNTQQKKEITHLLEHTVREVQRICKK